MSAKIYSILLEENEVNSSISRKRSLPTAFVITVEPTSRIRSAQRNLRHHE